MRRLGVVAAIALVAAGPAAANHREPGRWTTAQWKASLSKVKSTAVTRSVERITMRDGAQLSVTVHLPSRSPGQRVPALVELTPYDGSGPIGESWKYFTNRGAAYVAVDVRGTNASDGCLDFGGPADRADAADAAAWIRAQPWSNGVIVTDGISHPGMGSVVAHTAVPGLAGALAHAPVVSYYQDEWLQGAKFEDQLNGPLYQETELLPPLDEEHQSNEGLKAQAAACTGETAVDFAPVDGPFGPLWQSRDLSRFTPAERKPILLTHGFSDLNVHPDHSQMYWDALPDDYPKYLIFGWWYHGWPDAGTNVFRDIRHRWLDTLLFGRENGLWHEPRVLVRDSTGEWHEGDDWPLEQSAPVTLHADKDGTLTADAASPGTVSYSDRPLPTRGRWTGAHVAFRSAPLTDDRLVNGAPELDLVASSSLTSTKWVAYLMDEAPDGTWKRITHGYADSHTWKSPDTWNDLEPGKPYSWTLKLQPTAVVVEAGHRLALVVASQDSRRTFAPGESVPCQPDYQGGCYAPSGIVPAPTMGLASNSVHTGPAGTALRLHWADPAATDKALYP